VKINELEARITALEKQSMITQDIEEIKKLQRIYGYYIEQGMRDEIVDLFADGPDVALYLAGLGTFTGKEGVGRYFKSDYKQTPDSEKLTQVMQLSGVVDVSPDGQTAKGRWYGWGGFALPQGGGVRQLYLSGIYENDYIKENGKWKINVIRHCITYAANPREGWVKPERAAAIDPKSVIEEPKPNIPDNTQPRYPSGYIFPFHFTHPITGKETSEKARNAYFKKQVKK
jgi:hypothetical protein